MYFDCKTYLKDKPELTKTLPGRLVEIIGQLEQDVWEGSDGKKKYAVKIMVKETNIAFIGKGSSNTKGTNTASGKYEAPPDFDDDIPF